MAGAQISTSVSIIDNLKGYMALSLTEYNTSAAAAIAAGSVVEIAGAFFTFAADETPTGWTAITTGNTAYIALTASGTAGSQVVNAGYVSTAPTWRDDLQGWYASAASSVRIVASVYKAESTSYYPKYVLMQYQESSHIDKLKISEYIDSDTVSASSSMTISGYPVSSFHQTATTITTILPVGSIIAVELSASTAVNTILSPRIATGFGSYLDNSRSTSTGSLLSGTWVSRGMTGSTSPYMAICQRIS